MTEDRAHTQAVSSVAISTPGNGGGCDLLQPDHSRFVLFPIRYPDIWTAYKNAVSCFWTPEEIRMDLDREEWNTRLSDAERQFLSVILAFFAASDGIVVENLAQRFCGEVQLPEARCFYGFQIAMENIHSEVYSRLLHELIGDSQEQARLFTAVETVPVIKGKADWCLQWIESKEQDFPTRLVAFAIVEGVFFCSSFAAIYWIRQRGILRGLTHSNELISRDESLHMNFACTLYRLIGSPVPKDTIHAMIRQAVALEVAFFREALPAPLLGMNATLMSEYVRHVGDVVLNALGTGAIFHSRNPFVFMENTSVNSRANFFERSVSDYIGASVEL